MAGGRNVAESLNRIMVNSVVKKAIRDLKMDPERTIRNLIDMALNFADSRIQQQVYSAAQGLLANEKSGYYDLVKDVITKVDEQTLLTFGMNLGYNGLYEAADKIRASRVTHGCSIPWSIALSIAEGQLYDRHHTLITQGEALGIHSWQLFSQHGVHECLSLATEHPDSAFVIFCGSYEIDRNVIDRAGDNKNIALIVSFDAETDAVCPMLRDAGILFGLFYTYHAGDLERIESGELMYDMQQLKPATAMLRPQSMGDQVLRQRVSQWIAKARMEQEFHMILIDLYSDMQIVDGLISNDPSWMGFDEYGQLCTENGPFSDPNLNLFRDDLVGILRTAFPI